MFKSDSEVKEMLEHKNNGTKVIGIGKGGSNNSGGNGKGSKERLTTEEKSEIGTLATLIGTGYTAELTGEHKSAVSHYKNGINGNGTVNADLREENNKRLNTIREKAIDKATLFMNMLNEEKALKMKGKDLATVADKMVNIFDKLGPKSPLNIERATVIFHAPRVRKSEDYNIIDVEPIVSN